MVDSVTTMAEHDQADAGGGYSLDDRMGITPLGAMVYGMARPELVAGRVETHLLGRTQTAMLGVVKAALMASDSWSVCYEGCSCVRCCLYHATRHLTEVVHGSR